MGYNMTKYAYELWDSFENASKQNKKNIKKDRKKFVKDSFQAVMGKEINIDNPKTFTEKLNANKVNLKKAKCYSFYADKHKVRKYVKETIGEEHLIPHYFSKRRITVKDLEKLPNSFVLKTNNASSSNYIVMDKTKEDLNELCAYMNRLVKIKFGNIHGELLYNYVKPRIVAEKLMLDSNHNIPDDLKCFCFIDEKGVRRKILYTERVVGDDRKRVVFDEDWKPININIEGFEKLNIKVRKPKNSKKILQIIDKLSAPFNFVRVDLYLLKDKIYFGELTFIPTAGYIKFNDEKTDLLWGSYVGDQLK